MFTLQLLVKVKEAKSASQLDFYNPAVDWASKFPHTEAGLIKAFVAMKAQAVKQDWILDYKFRLYKGKVMHYTRNPELIAIFDKSLNEVV
jgi:hypothetical protein